MKKYNGQQILHIKYMLMNELKLTMLESRNLYHMKTIIDKVVETEYYYYCVFYKSLAFTGDRYIAEDVDSLQKHVITYINTLEEVILKTSTNIQNTLSMVHKKFLKLILGKKPPPIMNKRKIEHDVCISSGKTIRRHVP